MKDGQSKEVPTSKDGSWAVWTNSSHVTVADFSANESNSSFSNTRFIIRL